MATKVRIDHTFISILMPDSRNVNYTVTRNKLFIEFESLQSEAKYTKSLYINNNCFIVVKYS